MKKFQQWFAAAFLFFAVWFPAVFRSPDNFHLLLTPAYLVALLGALSVLIVLYRIATFNDCPEAAYELQEEIKEAHSDLLDKGFKFSTENKQR